MLPGLSFFHGCLQKRRAKRIYLLDPSHKDNEPQNGGVQQGGVRVGTPRETHVTGESHYSVCINSAASLKMCVGAGITVCQGDIYGCFDQRWLHVSGSTVLDICHGSNTLSGFACTLRNRKVLQNSSLF